MKAMAITQLGGPEVIQNEEIAAPGEPASSHVVIRTLATSYNNVDALLRLEDFGLEFPVIPGSDLVGEIVSGKNEGKRVIVNPGIPCESCDRCAVGLTCRYVKILGVHCPGAYGEYVDVPEQQCTLLPVGIAVEVAAAFPLTFLTSWRLLKTRANVESGQTVLIWGATGGLGSAAVSVCNALGGRSIAISRRASAVDPLLEYGADHVIDISSQDLDTEVRLLTEGRGVDVVFEGPGSATWASSMSVVAQGGVIVTAGVTTGNTVELDVEDLYYRQISILGSRMGYAGEFSEVLDQLIAGNVRPLISAVKGLSEARDVHANAGSGTACGKVVMMYDL